MDCHSEAGFFFFFNKSELVHVFIVLRYFITFGHIAVCVEGRGKVDSAAVHQLAVTAPTCSLLFLI